MNTKLVSALLLYLACAAICGSVPAFADQPPPDSGTGQASGEMEPICPQEINKSDLTLEKAVAAALKYNPDLTVSKFMTRLAETERQIASMFPNPELAFEYENFDEPEKTLTIGYLIELGGKRRQRMDHADAGIELAQSALEGARVEIIHETATAFIDVLVAQENLNLAHEKEKLADQVYETSKERVLAGRVSPMEQVTAKIKKIQARLDVQTAEDDLLIARTNLSAMWGSPAAGFNAAAGELNRIQPVPSFESLISGMENAPRIKTQYAEIKVAEFGLDLEKRNRIPDLAISGGVKKIDESDDPVYLVGLSLPIPLFDRNQSSIARSAENLGQQTAALSAEKSRITRDLTAAYQTLKSAHQQVNTIQTEILPAAQSVLDAVKEGYQEGEFGFLEMLEAQSTLYESHESHVQSLGQYHRAVIDLEKILGKELSHPDFN